MFGRYPLCVIRGQRPVARGQWLEARGKRHRHHDTDVGSGRDTGRIAMRAAQSFVTSALLCGLSRAFARLRRAQARSAAIASPTVVVPTARSAGGPSGARRPAAIPSYISRNSAAASVENPNPVNVGTTAWSGASTVFSDEPGTTE